MLSTFFKYKYLMSFESLTTSLLFFLASKSGVKMIIEKMLKNAKTFCGDPELQMFLKKNAKSW